MADYSVLGGCFPHLAGKEVLLAVTGPDNHVVALTGEQAAALYAEGRLSGWTPANANKEVER